MICFDFMCPHTGCHTAWRAHLNVEVHLASEIGADDGSVECRADLNDAHIEAYGRDIQ